MSRFRSTKLAVDDLAEIVAKISRDRPDAADRLISSLFKVFALLATHPNLGPARPEYVGANLRSFSVGSYVVFHRLRTDALEIARILHGARDIDSLMGG